MFGIVLDRHNELSLSRQIYIAIRELIHNGKLMPGETIPSSRNLANTLGVSRNTISEAYEMLFAEGYIITRQGALSRVVDNLYLATPTAMLSSECPAENDESSIKYDFRTGQPDFSRFPIHIWSELMRNAIKKQPLNCLGYSGTQGVAELRIEIASWLFRSRGLQVDPCNIFITTGTTQALFILSKILSQKKKNIIVEDPCHIGMLRALKSNDINIVPVPVDSSGIQTEHFRNIKNAIAVYITPSHQFPLGGVLSAKRRTEIINYARENDSYIIEDDYDSEFRYNGSKIAPLYSLDQSSVIYVGTFSKILFPSLRIGYAIIPRKLHKEWIYARTYMDVQNTIFEQYALSDFLHTRKLDRHVLNMSRLYGQRRNILLEAINIYGGNSWDVLGYKAGLHLVLSLPCLVCDKIFYKKCLDSGIYVTPVDYYSIKKDVHLDKLLLGYAHIDSFKMFNGIKELFGLIKNYYS